MILVYGNMWDMWGKTDLFIVTGNASLRKDGLPVMGRGIAKEFKDRFSYILGDIGYLIEGRIYVEPYYGLLTYKVDEQKFGLFQVKRWWHEKASLSIIERSAYELLRLAEENPYWRIDINYPAIGNGGRTVEEIEPIIKVLPDNVHIWQRYRRRNIMPRWGKGDPEKVRPNYENEGLEYLAIPENGSIDVRLMGAPVIWQAHWPSIWSTDGEKRVPQPMCCNKFDPESLVQNVSAKCILCEDDDDLPLGITYEKDWDRGPKFRGSALCIDRAAQEAGEPYIKSWSFPITVYDEIERFAQKWGNPADDEEGYDISVRKEVGDFVKYKCTPDREISEIDEEEQETYEQILPTFEELYTFRNNEEILERIEEIIESLDTRSSRDESKSKKKKKKAKVDDDEERPRKKKKKAKVDDDEERPRKKKKKKVKEVDEEDEDESGDAEEEGEGEEDEEDNDEEEDEEDNDDEEGDDDEEDAPPKRKKRKSRVEDEDDDEEETPKRKKKKKALTKKESNDEISDDEIDALFDELDL